MKIFVWRDNEELGPFSRMEVFARLQKGELSKQDPARVEGMEEWAELSEILQQTAASSLFSPAQIQAQTEEREEIRPIVPEILHLRPRKTSGEAPAEGTRLAPASILLIAAAVVCAVFAGALFYFQQSESQSVARESEEEFNGGNGGAEHSSPRLAKGAERTANSSPLEKAPPDEIRTGAQVAANAPIPAVAALIPAQREGDADTSKGSDGDLVGPALPAGGVMSDNPALSAAVLNGQQMASLPATNPATEPKAAMGAPEMNGQPAPPAEAVPAPAPTPRQVTALQIPLQVSKAVPRATLWVAETSSEPKGILLICVNEKEKVESLAKDKTWQAFAEENQLTLAAASFAAPRAERGAGDVLLKGLDGHFKKPLPLVLYGRDDGGQFASTFASWRPNRVALWIAYQKKWDAKAPKQKSAPPGLVACDKEDADRDNQAKAYFQSGRNAGHPWNFVALSIPWKERRAQFENFLRDYSRTILAGSNPDSQVWISLERMTAMSGTERWMKPAECAWFPDASLVPAWTNLVKPKSQDDKPTFVQRSIETNNPRQPRVDMYLRIPPLPEGVPIKGVLAYCTWENDHAGILEKLKVDTKGKQIALSGPAERCRALIAYAEQHQMAVLTWGTVEAWNNHASTEELERDKQREFDRNFDRLATAWERGVKELARETGIPDRNFLLYGVSRGAQWAHRLALRKPDYFLAVHVHIPSTFDKPTPEACNPLWLLTTGELEYGYERALRFYEECRGFGYPMIFKGIIGLGHQGSAVADALGMKFFDYALSVQALREELDVKRKSALASLSKQTAGPWLKDFRQPPFYGDAVNQECLPGEQQQLIPSSFRVPLPTKVLAEAWNR